MHLLVNVTIVRSPAAQIPRRDIWLPNLKRFLSSSICCVLRIAFAVIVWQGNRRGCVLKSSGKSQPAHLKPTLFSANRPSAQSHLIARCRARPDPTRLCMPMFAVLSVSTSNLSFRPASARSCTDCNPPAAARPAACSSAFSAGEGYDVLRRAAVVDGVGTELFKGPRRTPSGFGASNRSRRSPRTRRARHGPA